jgi:hypothetical protein
LRISVQIRVTTDRLQVRGKKNLVIEKALAGTIGLFVKFSTLQEYGVDKVFFLENHNVDATQRNVVFLVRGENAKKTRTVAGMIRPFSRFSVPRGCGPISLTIHFTTPVMRDHKDSAQTFLCSTLNAQVRSQERTLQFAKTPAYHITHHEKFI